MTHVSVRFVRIGPIFFRALSLLPAISLLAAASFAQLSVDSVVTLPVARPPVTGAAPVTQSFIQTYPPGGPAAAIAVLILLPGGDGNIQLTPIPPVPGPGGDGTLDVNSGNFLVRGRWLFAAEGFAVLTLDSATDFQQLPTGLTGQQGNPAHVMDVLQVINYARTMLGVPAVPVWLVGTSRGTAGAWVAGGPNPPPIGPDGLVFTSPVNISGDPDSLLSAPLATIMVPTLIFNNKASTCAAALASGDPPVLKALTAAPVKANENVNNAGFPALSSACEALSPHGYFGIEPEVVTKISNWIIAN